jgi:hypothetical protein
VRHCGLYQRTRHEPQGTGFPGVLHLYCERLVNQALDCLAGMLNIPAYDAFPAERFASRAATARRARSFR